MKKKYKGGGKKCKAAAFKSSLFPLLVASDNLGQGMQRNSLHGCGRGRHVYAGQPVWWASTSDVAVCLCLCSWSAAPTSCASFTEKCSLLGPSSNLLNQNGCFTRSSPHSDAHWSLTIVMLPYSDYNIPMGLSALGLRPQVHNQTPDAIPRSTCICVKRLSEEVAQTVFPLHSFLITSVHHTFEGNQ